MWAARTAVVVLLSVSAFAYRSTMVRRAEPDDLGFFGLGQRVFGQSQHNVAAVGGPRSTWRLRKVIHLRQRPGERSGTIDIGERPEAIEGLRQLQGGGQIIPTVVYPDRPHHVDPAFRDVSEHGRILE